MRNAIVSTSPPRLPMTRPPLVRDAAPINAKRLGEHMREAFIDANELRADIVMGGTLDDDLVAKLRDAHDHAVSIERSTRKSLEILARRRADATGQPIEDFIRPLGAVPMSRAEAMTREAFRDAAALRDREIL